MNKQDIFTQTPAIPYEGDCPMFLARGFKLVALQFTGWRDETMSWKKTAYIGAVLNPAPTYIIKGREALKFLSDTNVNSFKNFPVGTGKHGIMCTQDGLIMMDGVIIRTAEDEFITYWLQPYIAYAFQKGSYDAQGEDITGRVFLFQVAGPRSLEALERASGDDLHDIKFMHHRTSRINGIQVRILRMGMAGTLAYEVHGAIEGAQDVYRAIFSAGKEYGMRKLGQVAYMMNHTEDGFPQAYYHFPYSWYEDPGFAEYLDTQGGNRFGTNAEFRGSMGPDPKLHYRNPVELGWAGMIKFDHDFVGRKALEPVVANPKRRMVTLEWSIDDVIDIYASQFRDEELYPPMDRPNDVYYESARAHVYHADRVLKDGKLVGISSGRSISQFYRKMLSLCSIDIEFSKIGTDLIVLWGDPGTRQKEVRAKVARFPYLNENRNQDVDVSAIPKAAKG